jgi:hypothetical protein
MTYRMPFVHSILASRPMPVQVPLHEERPALHIPIFDDYELRHRSYDPDRDSDFGCPDEDRRPLGPDLPA